MRLAELLELIEAHEQVERERKASSLLVWAALSAAEPELAREILQLFSTVDASAQWVASPFREFGHSPAREAAEGRAADLMARVHRTNHGFVG